jgi:hypothetical protein
MKSKVNIPSRGKSNPPLKNLPPSSLLEEQTRKMEQQLKELKDVMAQKAMSREPTSESQDGSRWQSANPNLPIRNYPPKAVLESKGKGTLGSTSGSKNSTLTFTSQPQKKIPREKLSSREKLAPIPGVTSSTPSNTSFKNKENESQKGFFQDTLSNEATSQTSLTTPVKSTPKQTKPSVSKADVDRSAENNLMKALKSQKEETDDEVSSFLQEIGLPQYIQAFKDNGFDDLETVMEIQTKHLVDMKIPAGHQIKLTKRIENLRANDPNRSIRNTLPTPTQKSTSQATTNNGVNVQQIKSNAESYYGSKTNDYVQLAEPTKEMAIGDDRKGGGELLGGTFNEAESHQSFLEALNEWRTGKAKPVEAEKTTVPRAKESRSKKVRFAEAVPEKEEKDDDVDYISTKPKAASASKPKEEKKQEAPKSFLFSGGSAWNQVEVPDHQEHGTGMSPRSQPQVKVSCWNCYRLIPENEIISIGQKQVCSEQCAKTYRQMNSTKCTKKGCGNAFLKEDGLLIEGKWYCSEKCAPTAEELLMEEQRMLKRLQNEEGHSGSNIQEESRNFDDQEPEEDDEQEAFELSVEMSNKKEVLTLAELEEKYKNMNKMAEKAQAAGNNEFEDSLN